MTRKEVQKIRDKALECTKDIAPLWEYAYRDLAEAADRLDAMMARTEIKSNYTKNERQLELF